MALLALACGPAPSLEPLEVSADGKWLRDASGRVVLLRGANYPGLEFPRPEAPPEAADFAQLASWGVNVIRLPLAWSWLEPTPGAYDEGYLAERVDPVLAMMDEHGMVAVLELHQFQWSACFPYGNGAPAWVCDGKSYPDSLAGYAAGLCDFFRGDLAPDARPLLDHFLDAWALVARRYAGDRRVAGLDMLNEPHAIGCLEFGVFERDYLFPLYRRWREVVRQAGAQQTLFVEPPLQRNVGLAVHLEALGDNVVYAPHLYTQTGGEPTLKYDGNAAAIAEDYAQAAREAAVLGGPLFAAEFGGSTLPQGGFLAATERFVRDTLDVLDRRLLGGAVWAYFPFENVFGVVDASGAERGRLGEVLSHPFARRIAGIPTRMRFDPESGEFTLSFSSKADAAVKDPTEVFLPMARRYPSGAEVTTSTGARVETAGDVLLFFRGEGDTHSLSIRPRTR